MDEASIRLYSSGSDMRRRWMQYYKYPAALLVVAFVLLAGLHIKTDAKPSRTHTTSTTTSSDSTHSVPEADTTDRIKPSDSDNHDRLPFMTSSEADGDADQPSSLGLLARTFGALLLVIGLLIASVWCLRRIKGGPFNPSGEGSHLSVLKTVAIGDRRSLIVVRFDDRTLLLGATPQSITLLASDEYEALQPLPKEELLDGFPANRLLPIEEELLDQPMTATDEFERLEKWY